MAHIDKVKEEIGWLKVVFAISLATVLSLIAWLVENYGKGQKLPSRSWWSLGVPDYVGNHLDK